MHRSTASKEGHTSKQKEMPIGNNEFYWRKCTFYVTAILWDAVLSDLTGFYSRVDSMPKNQAAHDAGMVT